MASPQRENGYTAIANELLEQLVATPLPDVEHRMFLFIIRQTYGFQKKEDSISLTQFEKALKRSRPVIHKALKNLLLRNMVVRTPLLAISVVKDYEKWVVAPPLLVANKHKIGSYAPTPPSSPAPTHKRKVIKKTKEISITTASGGTQIALIIDSFKVINPSYRELFKRPPQRAAAERLVKNHGLERILKIINDILPKSNQMTYAPTITTPIQLEEKYAQLKSFLEKERSKELSKQLAYVKI